MINEIKVNGFRSLKNFSMEIKKGLNVLVGPNGSGKTNIILFFEFMRLCGTVGVRESVSRMGGAGQVFRKRGKERFCDSIQIEITGDIFHDGVGYEYVVNYVIRASLSEQEVYFERQYLKINRKETSVEYMAVSWLWDGEKSVVDIQTFPARDSVNWWGRDDFEKHARPDWFTQTALASYIGHFDEIVSAVSTDLSSRFMLNVVPSAVKAPEDSTREPGIDSDGSGLSATLHAIKKNRLPDSGLRFSFGRGALARKTTWSKVVSLIKVAVPTIEDIDVQNEPFDNKLRAMITIGKGNQKTVLPLSAMSDGTVKWMSLVTRLATSSSALLLEEPENYLHPLMQTEIVRLLRDSTNEGGFALISTHSETLLNALRVEELVVVSYAVGGTRAQRVSNSAELTKEIAATGFGLGYYYLADAIRS